MGNGQYEGGIDFSAHAALGDWYYVLCGMAAFAVVLLLVGLPWLLWRYEQRCRRVPPSDST